MTHDILIRGGLLLDGTGAAGRRGDLAIGAGRIVAMGTDLGADAAKLIDATGLAVAPGFIDIKTHSDFTLPINPKAESKVRQGVTTEIIGHCGFSVAPALPGKVELLRDYLSPSAPWLPFKETTFPDYLDDFPATAVNAGMLVGHNTLRLMVMGMADRAADAGRAGADDRAAGGRARRRRARAVVRAVHRARLLRAARRDDRALPRGQAPQRAAISRTCATNSNKVLDAVDEAIAIAETCGVHVEIVHFKCSGMDNWGKAAQALDMIAAARARGLDVDCDAYPYAAGSNPLKNLLPQWVQAGGVDAMLERLALEADARRASAPTSPRRPQQLGPPAVVGLRADLDLAAPAAVCRPHHRRARGRARPGSDRHRRRLPDRGQGRDARARHLDLRRTTSAPSCARRLRSSAPTAIASRPTAP